MLFSEVENLLLNMMGGLLPEYLTEKECLLLKENYGENWFYELGYNDVDYRKPSFS